MGRSIAFEGVARGGERGEFRGCCRFRPTKSSTWRTHLRATGAGLREAVRQGVEKLVRPVTMTALAAILGLLPAAMSHDIGSDSQRPFAIVIVGGLIVELFISVMLLPTLYVFWAGKDDKLPPPEIGFIEEGEHVD